jgi:non-ribosomal peptide synthase protein (TIGR01720 family)
MRWLVERGGPLDRFSQSILLQAPKELGEEQLLATLQTVLDYHDALRLRLMRRPESGEWDLQIAPPGAIKAENCTRRIDITGMNENERQACLVEEATAAGRRLEPGAGVMTQAVWFDAGGEEAGRLLLTIHHLAIDGVSWRILVQDLKLAWEAMVAGMRPELGTKSSSFRRWAGELSVHARDEERVKELPLWTEMLSEPAPLLSDGLLDPSSDTVGTAEHITLRLPASITNPLLTTVPTAFHGQINDVLLTALAVAVARWQKRRGERGSRAVLVNVEGHGREEIFEGIDLSRTVGWFTSLYPVRLDTGMTNLEEAIRGGRALGHLLKMIKEQLRRLPDGGLGYGLLRYLNPETGAVLAGLEKPQISFNYLGRFVASAEEDWAIAPEAWALGSRVDDEMPLAHCLEVNVLALEQTDGPELNATWSWASRLLTEQEVRDLAEMWFEVLEVLANHGVDVKAVGRTPSDLPLVSLTQTEIERLEREHLEWSRIALFNHEQSE